MRPFSTVASSMSCLPAARTSGTTGCCSPASSRTSILSGRIQEKHVRCLRPSSRLSQHLTVTKSAGNLAVGRFDAASGAVRMLSQRGSFPTEQTTHVVQGESAEWVDPELAASQVEMGRLLVVSEDERRPVSIFELHEAMHRQRISSELHTSRSSLVRLGYTVRRLPSVFKTETPYPDIWQGTLWDPAVAPVSP